MDRVVLSKYVICFKEDEAHIGISIQEIYGGIDAFYYEHLYYKNGDGDHRLLSLVEALSTKWFTHTQAKRILFEYQAVVI